MSKGTKTGGRAVLATFSIRVVVGLRGLAEQTCGPHKLVSATSSGNYGLFGFGDVPLVVEI